MMTAASTFSVPKHAEKVLAPLAKMVFMLGTDWQYIQVWLQAKSRHAKKICARVSSRNTQGIQYIYDDL